MLNSRGVDYVIVGGQSLDIFARATPHNARLLVDLLKQFGLAHSGFKEADFMKPEQFIQLGRAPNRIDLLIILSGVISD